jgi:hypothetical protein
LWQKYTEAVKNRKAVGGGSGEKEKLSKKELNLVGSGGEVVEFFDGREEMVKKVEKVVELVKNAKHMTAFTGAGISTSAGLLPLFFSLSLYFLAYSLPLLFFKFSFFGRH